jgi:hypothetical protein
MYGAPIDSTFGFIAARAARYPIVRMSKQPRTIMKGAGRALVTGDPGIRWLLLNAQKMNRCLKGTG